MSTQLEGRVWQYVKTAFAMLPESHCQRIEVWSDRGVLDVEWCHKGKSGWIELKSVDSLGQFRNLRPEQVAWIRRRTRAGGSVYIIVLDATDTLRVYHGKQAKELKEVGLRLQTIAHCAMNDPDRYTFLHGILGL